MTMEELKNEIEKGLTDTIVKELLLRRNKNISIDNIRIEQDTDGTIYALADVTYVWHYHKWNKKVTHWDMFFVLDETKDEWTSPLFE